MTDLPARIETTTDDLCEDVAQALGWKKDRDGFFKKPGDVHWTHPAALPDFCNSIDAQTRWVPGRIAGIQHWPQGWVCEVSVPPDKYATRGATDFYVGRAPSEPRARLAALLRAMGAE